MVWHVKFEPGTLKIVSRKAGKTVLTKEVHTAGKPAKIELSANRSSLNDDGKDLSFITVRVLDKDGNVVPDANNMVNFSINGPAHIAGVDNGSQVSLEPFKADHRKAFHGLCLAIIQANNTAGKVAVKATSKGLTSAAIVLNIRKK